MKMPGSPVPKGTQEWSFPPIILRPRGPPDFTNITSYCGIRNDGYIFSRIKKYY